MKSVFILWHSYELNEGEEEIKLLGVFSSEGIAIKKISEYKKLPGFCDHLDGFEVVSYKIDVDQWKEGFVTQSEDC